MRKTVKMLHSVAACGLIGGLGCYMILLAMAAPETPAGYADLRQAIAAISNYLLLPSLAIALISGLLSMAVHQPFLDQGWAWLKAATGILMFKGVLTIVGAKADYAAVVARKIANGEASAAVLDRALAQEWYALAAVMALSLGNVVVGIWRPKLMRPPKPQVLSAPVLVPATDAPSQPSERARPAA